METRTSVLACMAAALLCIGGRAWAGADRHRLTLDSSRMTPVAAAGEANVVVVTGQPVSPTVRFAAQELAAFLGQAIGGEVPIRTSHDGPEPGIYVGDQPKVLEAGVEVSELPRDAFVIRSVPGGIVIAGRDDARQDPLRDLRGVHEHATLFGVYEFLERFVGVRFYFPGPIGTVVPSRPDLSLPAIDLYEQPDCDQRRIYAGPKARWYEELSDSELRRARMLSSLRLRKQTVYIPCCHGLSRRCLAQRFGEEHPEWFALLPNGTRDTDMSLPGHRGHLCYLNEGLRAQIYRETEGYLLGRSAADVGMITKRGSVAYDWNSFQPGYVDLCPQDGLGPAQWCQMPECRRFWDDERQGELIWGLVADVADRLKENGVPGYVTCFAYGQYREVPEVELPDNVLVQLCISGPWDDRIPARRQRNDALIRQWNAACRSGKIWLWNYMNNYNGQVPEGVPPLSPHLIQQYYSRIGPDIRGAFNESEIGYWLFNYLNYYVFHRMMWNTETDVDALLEEHHRLMFGPAAETMGRFFSRLESIWTTQFLGEVIDTPLGPTRTRRTDREVWDEIFTDEVMGELDGLLARAETEAADQQSPGRRVRFFRERFFGEMCRVRDHYRDKQRGVEDLVARVPPLPDGASLHLDGRLDETVWQRAETVWLVPLKNDLRAVKTSVRLLWSPGALYLGFDCLEPHPDRLYLAERTHDDPGLWKDAGVEIFLNPTGDRQHYTQLMVNARGIVSDVAYVSAEGAERQSDASWTSDARVATWIGADRWQAEIQIPAEQVAGEALAAGREWVANLCRNRNITQAPPGDNQHYTWSPYLKGQFHDLANMGRLRFVASGSPAPERLPEAGSFDAALKGRRIGKWYWPSDKQQRACFAQDEHVVKDGRWSLRIHTEDESREQALHTVQYLPPFQPGKRYLLTFWVRAENVEPVPGLTGYKVNHAGGFANIYFGSPRQSGNNVFFPRGGFRKSFPWTRMAFEVSAPATVDGDKPTYMRLSLVNATGTVWYDDVHIRQLD